MQVSRVLIYPLRRRFETHRADLRPRELPAVWNEARERVATRPFDETQTIRQVFDKAAAKVSYAVTREPRKLRGVPCLRGTRIPLYQICGMIAEGKSQKKVARALRISEDQVKTALRFASIVLEQ